MPVRYKPSKTAAVFEKLGRKLNPTRLFQRARQPAQARSIYINSALPNEFYDKKGKVVKEKQYPSNQTLTSKYTVITFLPRNLFEQVRRLPCLLS
jgi:phospholipid-translocating ATPase